MTEDVQKSSFIFYRADHFEKAGVDPAGIKTVDDFTEALRKLKEYYKDVDNYYPLQGREAALIFRAGLAAAVTIFPVRSLMDFTTITSTAAMIFMQTALIKWWRR